MGIPKFFRYMSERYPCLNEKLREYQIPEFDNLYLDMNGIIHVCSHSDDNPLNNIPEETVFKDIFYYIELMFRLIQPKKVFMMAVDGVAPRAKMNQQRGRRYRSAKDAEIAANRAVITGLPVPLADRFDSNCITPGTEFMDRLHQHLKYFIAYKISTDKIWRRPKIILSGHDTPGEGEHKIMDYIRYLRTRDDYQPNTRHCLHGLDADLVILGLCSHELHFSLLREEVKFGRNNKRPANPEEIQFFLLHLSLMRDYLGLEFQALKNTLPFPYDLEKIVDDWVLMGFLVGNDFIPNLPSLHINENALHVLYQIYIEVLPTLGGYINEKGVLNLERFEKYMKRLADIDMEHFKDIECELSYLESKKRNKKRCSSELSDDIMLNEEIMNMINATKNALCNTEEEKLLWDSRDTEADLTAEFNKYKTRYYVEKMEFKEVTDEVLRCQAECYIRAIQWNLHYYYHGCCSWSWYYPFHYAPFISDIKGFCHLGHLDFDLGTPFTPFQQLLGVLPPASRKILPEAFQHLMVSPESPILRFYPDNFQTDLNGKQQIWEAVVLLPFIDQDALIAAMEPYYKNLTLEEQRRNNFAPMTIFEYTKTNLGILEAPEFFPPVEANHAETTIIWSKQIRIPREKVVWGLLPGAQDSSWYGFPCLKYIPFKAKLKDAKVQVFQQPSRGLNMMLCLNDVRNADEDLVSENVRMASLEESARKYLGKEIYVNWPHLIKAYATCVTNRNHKFTITEYGEIKISELNKDEIYYWNKHGEELSVKYKNTLGIEIGHVDIIVFAKQLVGSVYVFRKDGTAKKKLNWSSQADPHPIQTVVDNIKILPCEKLCGGELRSEQLCEIFPVDQIAFLVKPWHYGAEVKVLESTKDGIKVIVNRKAEPNIDIINELIVDNNEQYYQGSVAAHKCGLGTSHMLSRLTGTILVQTTDGDSSNKVNIGLNMKFNKSNQELVGYTKKVDNRYWNYSEKAINLIKEYIMKFPSVVNHICRCNEDVYKKTDFFEADADLKLQEVTKWLAEQPYSHAERRNFNSEIVGESAVIELEKIISSDSWKIETMSVMNVNPEDLVLPISHINLMEPDSKAEHMLLDRIVSIRECHPIPLGTKGFIIGIEKKEDVQATLYDILLDVPITGGFQLHTKEKRCYRLTRHSFLNLSYGQRLVRIDELKKTTSQQTNNRSDLKINSENKTPREKASTPIYPNMQQNLRPENNSGSNNVSNFFSAYRKPNFANSLGQTQLNQPNQNPQSSPNSQGSNAIGGRGFQSPHQPSNANSEFQAMWNHLQHQKVPSETMPVLQPNASSTPSSKLSAAANEQTNALRKILKLRDSVNTSGSNNNVSSSNNLIQAQQLPIQLQQQQQQPQPQQQPSPSQQLQSLRVDQQHSALGRSPSHKHKNCSHSLSCCATLINYCQRTGCAYPAYGYNTNNATKEVSAVICFPDGRQFRGLPTKDKLTAAENAACQTLNSLTESEQLLQRRQTLKFVNSGSVGGGGNSGPTMMVGSSNQHQPQQYHHLPSAIARINNLMTTSNLPSPPYQWCQQNKRENWRSPESSNTSSSQDNLQLRPSPAFGPSNLVPNLKRKQTVTGQNSGNEIADVFDLLKPTAKQGSLPQMQMDTKIIGRSGGVPLVDKSNNSTTITSDIMKQEIGKTEIQKRNNTEAPTVVPIAIGATAPPLQPTSLYISDKNNGRNVTTTISTCAVVTAIGSSTSSVNDIITLATSSQQQIKPKTKSRLAARFSTPVAKQ